MVIKPSAFRIFGGKCRDAYVDLELSEQRRCRCELIDRSGVSVGGAVLSTDDIFQELSLYFVSCVQTVTKPSLTGGQKPETRFGSVRFEPGSLDLPRQERQDRIGVDSNLRCFPAGLGRVG